MLTEVPKIDTRNYKTLVEQIMELLVKHYCKDEWDDIDSLKSDEQAFALIQIFSRMMEITIQRLNRVPDKNFLTFLDLIGLQLLPPRIARVPLTFTMAEGESRYEKVPAGIQAATVQTKEKEAAVFETEKELTIILPKLAGTVSLNPDNDKWTDHTPVLIDKKEEGIEDLFKGQNAVPHHLYLGHKRLFSLEESITIILKVELKEDIKQEEITPGVMWEVKWYYYKDDYQDKIPLHVTDSMDPVVNLLNSGVITFKDVSGICEKTLQGIEKETSSQKSWTNHWIFAELITPIPTDKLPEINTIKAGIKTSPDSMAGTGTISSEDVNIAGDSTFFTKELKTGDLITAKGQTKTITSIDSDTSLSVDSTLDPVLPDGTDFTYLSIGTGTISSLCTTVTGDTTVTGVSTIFLQELKVGDSITADGQIRMITDITSDTELTVDSAFKDGLSQINFFFTPSPPIDFAFFNNSLLDLTRDFYPFGKEPKFNDTFHIGSKEVFSKSGARITLMVVLTEEIDIPTSNRKLRWEFWDGKSWRKLGETNQSGVDIEQGKYLFTDSTNAFKNSGVVTFTCPKIEPIKISSEENYWVRVRIIEGNYGEEAKYEEKTTPVDGTGKISSETKTVSSIDEKDNKAKFLEELNIGDFITADGQTRKVTEINSNNNLTIEKPFIRDLDNEDFTFFKMWVYHPPTFKPPSIRTLALTYKLETPMETLEVVLEYNNFLYQKQTETCKNENKYFKPFKPVTDVQQSLYLAFDQDISTLPVTLFFPLSEMFLTAVQILEFETSGPEAGATSVILKNVTSLKNKDIVEFRNQRGETEQRSITSIDVDTNTINWETGLANDFSVTGSTASLFPSPVLAWEYWDGNMWTLLQSVDDETENITKRGFVQFLAPDDLQKRYCFEFDIEQYWIRARLTNGAYKTFPKLKGIYTNTVWAHNLVSIQEEILGSSIGKPDQVFYFSKFPVIGISELKVLEMSITEEDRDVIISEEGKNAIKEFKEGNIVKYWVRWHEVKHFFTSKSNSRHYVIDYNNGKVIFGNGEMGMIPPISKDNIKCSYEFGGGLKGNVNAEEITILRTALPFVEAVTNPEAADGGGDKEDIDSAKERGPQTLKHRDRAVTYEDFVWLIRAQFPTIAKVKCLPATDPSIQHNPGWVTLIVVPDTKESKPIPTQQLISEIKSFLFERSSTYLTIRPQINLISSGYIKVWVETKVQYTSTTEAKTIESRIIGNLNKFFHPLRGGPENSGWEFGRNVYISEVYEVIENTEGVDYVDQLYLYASIQIYKLTLVQNITAQVSYPEHSKVTITGEKITYLLADRIERDQEMDRLTIMGFKEGDIIILSLSDGSGSVELKVKSVSHEIFGDILECETFMLNSGFPVGSIVMTYEGVESYIQNDVPAGDISKNPLKVAIIEENDEAVLYLRDDPAIKEFFTIEEVSEKVRTIFIEENYLIYSGIHTIYSGADDINEK